MAVDAWHTSISAESYLEAAFLRWVLSPACRPGIVGRVVPQGEVQVGRHTYRIDYEIQGQEHRFGIELDGYEFHGDRIAFTYDRLRQNDLASTGRIILRFSYDSIRLETRRCVEQLQAGLSLDPALVPFLLPNPEVPTPTMDPDPVASIRPAYGPAGAIGYFEEARGKLNSKTLRECQREAMGGLLNYFLSGGKNAACVMSVGAGKTALGVAACLSFTHRRAMVITPGRVIRGTFDLAFDHEAVRNVLYGLPGGPFIPGCRPPHVLTLDTDEAPIKSVTREELLQSEVIVTNFHSLGTGEDPDDLLTKLTADDIDFIVVDEAHIAAAESYQRTFRHFAGARTFLMSACFQRLDGRPIDADVVYRYRLIDSIADGNAKNLAVHRFSPDPAQTTYEMVWPDGSREEIVGREAILDLLRNERRLAQVTAKSNEPIRQVMTVVRGLLDRQAELLYPVKPRVLFAALGERHAEQIADIANSYGIPTEHLHHSMTESRIRSIRDRFEKESGNLQGIVQLKMLSQGYDFPPICVVVPMRPYGSFAEFYQFTGRGIRVITHPALEGRVGPGQQMLDIVYHVELGLDEHIDTIYRENDMDPLTAHEIPATWAPAGTGVELAGTTGRDTAEHPETFVLFERGAIEQHVVHDEARIEQRRRERQMDALAQRYAEYAQSTDDSVTFEQYVRIVDQLAK